RMKLNIADVAPAFSLPDQEGKMHKLADFHGQWTLLYFYPKDDTPGCTQEACAMRDNFPQFKKLKIALLGVSVDSVKSHAKFVEKYTLPFTLLADEEKVVVNAYGVWGKKKFMGREYLGISRTSFLIGPDGKIVKIYENVKSAIHATEVLKDLEGLL
ncbi:MAG: thioredoxin-dependent thiol peroxidase, partial [Patescibacteria group bacterium]